MSAFGLLYFMIYVFADSGRKG